LKLLHIFYYSSHKQSINKQTKIQHTVVEHLTWFKNAMSHVPTKET